MERKPPPLVIDSSRVLSYAFVDDIPFRRAGALYVDGKLLEHVPRLAICTNLGEGIGPMLFHCDEEWNVLGVSGAESVEAVKTHAEKNYPGVANRWIDLNTDPEALRLYDAETGGLRCSFCGKRPFEVAGWIEGANAIICRGCVETYHEESRAKPDDGSAS